MIFEFCTKGDEDILSILFTMEIKRKNRISTISIFIYIIPKLNYHHNNIDCSVRIHILNGEPYAMVCEHLYVCKEYFYIKNRLTLSQ